MAQKPRPRSRSGRTIGSLPARVRSCVLYGMSLEGEVAFPGWAMNVSKAALTAAIGVARAPRPRPKTAPASSVRRALSPARAAEDLVLVVCELGLSVRSRAAAADVPGRGFWASPIAVNGAALRRTVAALTAERVHLEFGEGRLRLDSRSLAAREV